MFKKKFKVRVRHFSCEYYCVEYAHYRVIPMWRAIYYWFEQSYGANTECWSTRLFKGAESAEEFAKSLTIESLTAYRNEQEQRAKDFYKGQKEYYRKHVPYNSKVISQ